MGENNEELGASTIDHERWFHGLLRSALGGVYTHRVVRSTLETVPRPDRSKIINDLLTAQAAGDVGFYDRRWSLPSKTKNTLSGTYRNLELPDGVKTQKGLLRSIPCDVLGANQYENLQEKSDGAEDSSATPNWQFFRSLVGHYRECLHLGGASRANHNAENHTQQFHLLDARARWWPDEAGTRPFRISRTDLGGPFLSALSKRPNEPILLGYPLTVASLPDDIRLVTPCCILQCHWSLDDVAITVTPMSAIPIINPEWVKKNRARRAFKSALRRLAELTSDDDNTLSLSGSETWSDIEGLTRTLSSFLPEMIDNGLDPSRLERSLNLDKADTLQNVLGLFLVSDNPYTKGCRADLMTITRTSDEDLSKTALASVFGAPCQKDEASNLVSPFEVSEDQFIAVRDGLREPLTVISGPPGTGKSQVVASLMVSAAAAGKSALFASHTHKAIDAVFSRINALSPDETLLLRAAGDEESGAVDFPIALDALLNRLRDASGDQGLELQLLEIENLNTGINEALLLSDQVSNATDELGKLWLEKALREKPPENDAAENSDFHLKVSFWSKLLLWLTSLFRVKNANAMTGPQEGSENLSTLSDSRLDNKISESEVTHKRLMVERGRKSTSETPLPETLSKVTELSKKVFPLLIERLEKADSDERAQLVDLFGNVGLARTRDEKLAVWHKNTELVLRHFPLWAATTLSVPGRIPAVPAMFDYVIIDEATTANIAEALPLFFRAKRAIIVGDRMQTGMISDLDPVREVELLERNGLRRDFAGRFAFSQVSLFDLTNSCAVASRHILRDHFRCSEEIAGFISEVFYDGQLFVRTNKKGLRPPSGYKSGMHWTDIAGPIEPAGKGCRSQAEASAIVNHLVELIDKQAYDGTVGVVTPFSRQAELIRHEIERRLTYDNIKRVNLIVGTSHQFQGDDRDVILVSLCYGPGMPRGSEWFLSKSQDWLNVAISRAKAVCHIFGNRTAAEKCGIRHIRRLSKWLSEAGQQRIPDNPEFESPWERRLYEALVKAGIKPITQYPLAGRRLDLAVVKDGLKLDIEVDGDTYHRDRDGFRKVSDLWRDHVITGLGWRVRRFWVYELRENMEQCVEQVRRDIQGTG